MYIPEADHQPADYTTIRALIPELSRAARRLADGSALSPDELVRDTLVAALRDWHRLPHGADPRPWLLGILGDRARDRRPRPSGAGAVVRRAAR